MPKINIKVVKETSKYSKDFKRLIKQKRDLNLLIDVIEKIINQDKLEVKYKDHQLKGDMKDYRELHIEPDWLLVYKIDGDTLFLVRTGSHSELF